MATRQYIGARYVPKFYQNSVDGSTQWEQNVVYEPLIYVTLTNGHMYISKKQVPATVGSPVNNIDYWLDIGSYNGFIEQLQNEIDDINNVTIPAIKTSLTGKQDSTDNNLATTNKTVVGAINEVNTAVGNINTALADKQDKTDNNLTTTDKTVVGAINEVDSAVDDLATKVGDLTNLDTTEKTSIVGAINELANKVAKQDVLLIGDSFCDANRGGYARGVATAIQEYMELDDDHFHIFAIGGAGFVANGWGKTFGDLLADAVTDTSFDHEAITDIVVQTAGNDVGSGESAISSINANLSSFVVTANQYFPNARIFIAPTLSRIENPPRDYTFRRQLQYVLANTGRIITIITNASLPMRLIRCFTDSVHPNATGCKMLGKLIGTALLGGCSVGEFYETMLDDFTIALDSSLTAMFNREHWVTGHGNSLELNFVGLGVTGSIAIQNTLTSGAGSVLLGTESSLVPNTDSATGLSLSEIPVHAVATIGGADVELGQATLNIVAIEDDYTKCNLYLSYRYCPTAGTATRIVIDPVRVDYQV